MKTANKFYISQTSAVLPPNKPVIFWDTCALLDILRIPIRYNLVTLNNYERIVQLIECGDIISITSEMVLSEVNDHYNKERQNMDNEQSRRKKMITDFAEYMESSKKRERIKYYVSILNVISRLELLLNRLMRNTYIIRGESMYRDFADFRLRNKMAPAARKAEYKDCYIWGTFLKLAHEYPHTKLVFMTSNPKDYQEGPSLYNAIQQDCNRANAQCVLNIGAAYASLK